MTDGAGIMGGIGMIGKNKWQDKKPMKPTKVVNVMQLSVGSYTSKYDVETYTYAVDVVLDVMSFQSHGIVSRFYIQAKDALDAYMKASRGEYDQYTG